VEIEKQKIIFFANIHFENCVLLNLPDNNNSKYTQRICLQFHSGTGSKFNVIVLHIQSLAIKIIAVYLVLENINVYNNYSFH